MVGIWLADSTPKLEPQEWSTITEPEENLEHTQVESQNQIWKQ